eukprot:g28845.t1
MKISDDKIMVSLDATALFTSNDIPLTKETMATLLEKAATQTSSSISNDYILNLLDLCLIAHFIFNCQVYKQINRTPMWSPISGLIAEAVVQRLEHTTLHCIQPKLGVRTNIFSKMPCYEFHNHYIGQPGRKLAIRIHEHQLAAKEQYELSLVSVHSDNEGHQFNLDKMLPDPLNFSSNF